MKYLRKIRILLSVVLAMLITLAAISQNQMFQYAFKWIKDIQFMQAVLALNIGVCAGWLIVSAVVGRIYCSSVCPLGTFQDFASWIYKKLYNHGKGRYCYSHPKNTIRYIILGGTIGMIIIGCTIISLLTDPYIIYSEFIKNLFLPEYQALMGKYVIPGILGVLISIFLFFLVGGLAFYKGRTFCNTICPVGSLYSLVSRRSVFQLEIDPDLCTSCGLCRDECKASCIDYQKHTIDFSRCIMCMNCVNVCPSDAIKFTASRKGLSTPLMQSLNNPKLPQVTIDGPLSLNK